MRRLLKKRKQMLHQYHEYQGRWLGRNLVKRNVLEKSVEISAVNVDLSKKGKVHSIPVKNNIGDFAFSVNGEKCKQVLRFLNGEANIFSDGDAHRALIFKDRTSNDTYLIMPLMV